MNRLLIIFAFLAVVSCAPKGAPLKQVRQLRYQEEAALEKQPRQLRLEEGGVLLRESPRMGKLSEYVQEPARYVPQRTSELTPEEMEQNKNAFYHFESSVDDKINGQTQSRSETREGNNVKGSYSYADGYVKKTVHYEADENGYRIVGEETEPLDGPHIDLEGTAVVHAAAHGTDLKYKIQSIPVEGESPKIVDSQQ